MRKRTSLSAVLAAIIAISLISGPLGCGSTRSPLETAKLSYADASLAYDGVMTTLVDLRAQHKITDVQWAEIDRAQRIVRIVAPQLRSAINLWESSGTKPLSYDRLAAEFITIIQTIVAVQHEVKP